jgi:hypothetical protein
VQRLNPRWHNQFSWAHGVASACTFADGEVEQGCAEVLASSHERARAFECFGAVAGEDWLVAEVLEDAAGHLPHHVVVVHD